MMWEYAIGPSWFRWSSFVTSLNVTGLDAETLSRLETRAARRGVSLEEEARRILQRALAAPDGVGELATGLFGSSFGVNLELPAHGPHDPVDLSG